MFEEKNLTILRSKKYSTEVLPASANGYERDHSTIGLMCFRGIASLWGDCH